MVKSRACKCPPCLHICWPAWDAGAVRELLCALVFHVWNENVSSTYVIGYRIKQTQKVT